MSHLLGNEECLQSLREDVDDIRGVLSEITSRTGPLEGVSSWKFPSTPAGQLDVDELLRRFAFSADDDLDNQVSHFSLLELVVDRLLFVFHCASAFHDQIAASSGVFRGGGGSSGGGAAKDPPPTSAGLIVKRFWLRIVKVCQGGILALGVIKVCQGGILAIGVILKRFAR